MRDDPEAFARLFELNYTRIFNFIAHSTGDVHVSMDLTSETFLKALQAVDRYDHRRAPFASWLYGIASKEIAMYYRRPDNSRTVPMSHLTYQKEIDAAREMAPREEVASAQSRLEAMEDFTALAALLGELPGKYRDVIVLRFIEERSFEETARILGRQASTVRTQCERGLKRLRRMAESRGLPAGLYRAGVESLIGEGALLKEAE